ncbi:hypothetical protein Barb7_02407 [Bacteroidales bacterium Barb7]|nr:hypothetical protein Barb7_02407 [Bacteroidales bacterium Barb7]
MDESSHIGTCPDNQPDVGIIIRIRQSSEEAGNGVVDNLYIRKFNVILFVEIVKERLPDRLSDHFLNVHALCPAEKFGIAVRQRFGGIGEAVADRHRRVALGFADGVALFFEKLLLCEARRLHYRQILFPTVFGVDGRIAFVEVHRCHAVVRPAQVKHKGFSFDARCFGIDKGRNTLDLGVFLFETVFHFVMERPCDLFQLTGS